MVTKRPCCTAGQLLGKKIIYVAMLGRILFYRIFNGLVGILKIISSLAGATFLKFGIDIPIIDNFTLTNTNAIDLLPGVMLINLDFAQI